MTSLHHNDLCSDFQCSVLTWHMDIDKMLADEFDPFMLEFESYTNTFLSLSPSTVRNHIYSQILIWLNIVVVVYPEDAPNISPRQIQA